jgi:hypothetical protein
MPGWTGTTTLTTGCRHVAHDMHLLAGGRADPIPGDQYRLDKW